MSLGTFNTNASPFYPSSMMEDNLIRIDNLPAAITKPQMVELLTSIIETHFDTKHSFEIIKFTPSYLILQNFDHKFNTKLLSILNGYEWLDKSLEAKSYNPNEDKTLPPFLMNLVKSPEDQPNFIEIPNEEGEPIKVNPCRLFVGNIPFSSTWPSLRNFLVNKCEEFEPGNDIEIIRVEIPMQSVNNASSKEFFNNLSLKNLNRLNSFHLGKPSSPSKDDDVVTLRGLSRGFAIVTTGNQPSSEKIIKYFDNIEFEGRTLTVRYDKFPDFNNYEIQQLYPNANAANSTFKMNLPRSNSDSATANRSSVINLAFERNLLQQKIYFANFANAYNLPTTANNSPYLPYPPLYYSNPYHNPLPPYPYPLISVPPPVMNEYAMPYHPAGEYKKKKRYQPKKNEEKPDPNLTEDEKARELVNSFTSLGLSTI